MLFDCFKDRVYSTALRILGNKMDAEDASQVVFTKVFKSIGSFKGDASLVTWIYRITVNTCFDMIRKRKPDDQTDDLETVDHILTDNGMNGMPGQVHEIIEREIRKLPQRARMVFVLYAIEGFKHEEVGKILDISQGTSKSQYFAAKAILRKRLLPYKEVLTDGL